MYESPGLVMRPTINVYEPRGPGGITVFGDSSGRVWIVLIDAVPGNSSRA